MEGYLATLLYGSHDVLAELDARGPVDFVKAEPFDTGAADIQDPVRETLAKNERDRLAKIAGLEDASWDAPLIKAVELSPAFLERSNRRLEKMRAAVEKVFAGHPQECREAIEIARLALINARNEALTLTAAA
jgi:hypothetical protein